MAHGHQLTHMAAKIIGQVDHHVVLNVGTRTDHDFIDVAPQRRVVPDAGLIMQGHPPDHIRARCHEGVVGDFRKMIFITLNGHGHIPAKAASDYETKAASRILRQRGILTPPDVIAQP